MNLLKSFLVLILLVTPAFAEVVECHKYTFQQFIQKEVEIKNCGNYKGHEIHFTEQAKKLIKESFKVHGKRFKTRDFYNNNYSKHLISFMVKSKGKHFPVYVNEKGIGYRAYFFDNGADYFKDERARIEHNGKLGFINKLGEVLIAPQYTFVSSFRNGYAKACQKCIFGKEGEHQTIDSDHWFIINKKNKKVPKIPDAIKLPFDLALQKSVLEKPFRNTPDSLALLESKCGEDKKFCKNYATFYFEQELCFSMDYYKYDCHEMAHSTFVQSVGPSKKPEEVLGVLKKVAKKDPIVNSHYGASLYFYGMIDEGLDVLKKSCHEKNQNACKLYGRLRQHALLN